MKWNFVEIGKLAEFINGYAFKPSDWGNSGLKIIRIQNLTSSDKDYNRTELNVDDKYLVQAGDLLISWSATLDVFEWQDEPALLNQHIFKVVPNYTLIDKAYFRFGIKVLINRVEQKLHGSTMKHINRGDFLSLALPLPPLPIQKKIAAVLEKADELRRKREKQIKRLDDLLQATFLDMFGDPVTNPKGWDVVKLGEISHKITDGVHAKPNYTTEGKPFISVVNITSGKIIIDNCKFVSEEDFEKFTKVNKPEYGDILYTKVGATYGIPAFVDVHDDFCLYVSVCLIKPNHDLINSRFLSVSMGMPYVKRQADSRIKGIGVPDLHLNQIREFEICCPPTALQQKFVDLCNKVGEEKRRLKKQLSDQNSLFNSLMQRAFK